MSPLRAEPALTLQDAFRLTLTTHPAVMQRRSAIGAAEDDLAGSRWKRFPTVTGEQSHQLERQSVVTTNGDRNAGTWRVEQPLWTGGRISSEIEGAEQRKGAAESALDETEQELLGRVAQSFGDCIRLQQRAAIAEDAQTEYQRLFDLIRRRAEQQVSAEVDVELARARLQQSRTDLMTQRAALDNARNVLGQLTGAAAVDRLTPPAVASRLPWSDAEAVAEAARRHSPTVHRLEAEAGAAVADVANRRAAIMPQLSARYEKFAGSAAVVPFDRWMLAVSVQPGAGLSSVSAIDAAGKRADAARSAKEASLRDVTEKAVSQYNEARSFVEQVGPTRDYARASASIMASYLRQYTTGRKTWLEVLNTQRELTQARYAEADVTSGLLVSALKLDILTGRLTRATLFDPERLAGQ